MPRYFLGIDPGLSGGLAVVNSDGWACALSMPVTQRDIWDWLADAKLRLNPHMAVIERVHSMPQQGVASTFTFGCSYGGLLMALTGVGIPFEQVTPQRWQKGMSIATRGKTESKTEFKNRLKAMAQSRFPDLKITLATSDALLIASFCKQSHNGTI